MKKDILDQIFVDDTPSAIKNRKRQNAIIEMATRYGYKINKNRYIISFWELSYNLNNCWYAPLFVSKKQTSKDTEHYGKWAINVDDLSLFKRMITTTINKMKGAKIKEQKFGVYYEITS